MSPLSPSRIVQWLAERLRFPVLFLVTATLFTVDVVVPDAIPFVDEILLGLATVLLGSWKRRKSKPDGDDVETSRSNR